VTERDGIYGGQFVDFLSTVKALDTMPFVAQMAELEWHLDRISHIYHQPRFDFKRLAKIPEEQHLNIRFKLAKTCHIQSSNVDLISLHTDLSSPIDTHKTASNHPQPSHTLILQNSKGESALIALTPQQWEWLMGVEKGHTLAQLCELKNTQLPVLMAQITDWIALVCIDDFRTSP
jgi:hypothetical protein